MYILQKKKLTTGCNCVSLYLNDMRKPSVKIKRDGENVSLYVKINDEWKYVLKHDKTTA